MKGDLLAGSLLRAKHEPCLWQDRHMLQPRCSSSQSPTSMGFCQYKKKTEQGALLMSGKERILGTQ
eukprot:1141380-Pelagomonas_calceolata.AAC.4